VHGRSLTMDRKNQRLSISARGGVPLHGAWTLWTACVHSDGSADEECLSYTIGAWEDWNEMIIWMDGRAKPTEHALHTQSGFTLGSLGR